MVLYMISDVLDVVFGLIIVPKRSRYIWSYHNVWTMCVALVIFCVVMVVYKKSTNALDNNSFHTWIWVIVISLVIGGLSFMMDRRDNHPSIPTKKNTT